MDTLLKTEGYASRSEAVRDSLHDFLAERRWRKGLRGNQLGVVVMVYDHDVPGVGDKLTDIQHETKVVMGSVQHWHLDDRNCLETLMVNGPAEQVRTLVERLESLRGVKQVKLIALKK